MNRSIKGSVMSKHSVRRCSHKTDADFSLNAFGDYPMLFTCKIRIANIIYAANTVRLLD
jgi:hypothetical protein